MTVVVDHFKVFSEQKSKNGKPYLTEEELLIFLKKGFLKNTNLQMQKINYENTEKGKVVLRFYELFVHAVTTYNEKSDKKRYIDLVTGCFDNLGQRSSIEALFKPNKTKQTW